MESATLEVNNNCGSVGRGGSQNSPVVEDHLCVHVGEVVGEQKLRVVSGNHRARCAA